MPISSGSSTGCPERYPRQAPRGRHRRASCPDRADRRGNSEVHPPGSPPKPDRCPREGRSASRGCSTPIPAVGAMSRVAAFESDHRGELPVGPGSATGASSSFLDGMKRLASRLTWWHTVPHKSTPRSTPQKGRGQPWTILASTCTRGTARSTSSPRGMRSSSSGLNSFAMGRGRQRRYLMRLVEHLSHCLL
jgi:hypothetical protein